MANEVGFLQRPEGKVGLAIPVIFGAAAIFFFGSAIGDFIVNAFDNVLHLTIVTATLAFMGWLVIDPHIRTVVSFLYLSLLRMFFKFDPLGNLKSIRTRFIERLAVFSKSLAELRGQRIKTQRSYDEAVAAKNKALSMFAAATKKGDQMQIQLCSNNNHRAQETIDEDGKQLRLYDILIEQLTRGYELCSFKIEDMKEEINHREKQMEDARISRNIVESAMSILKGNGMEQDIWDSSTRQIEDEYTKALGEVDNLLVLTKDVFDKQDMLQEANVQETLQDLDAWTTKNTGMMTGNTRQIQAPAMTMTAAQSIAGKPVYVVQQDGDEYTKLFKK